MKIVLKKKWVLIVDDEAEIRELIRSFLELEFGSALKIVEACDGAEASGKIQFQSFDCIITDLSMPKKEGTALITSIRASNLNSNSPIIVLSGHIDAKSFAETPFVYPLSKPFNQTALIKLVSAQLSLGKTNKRLAAQVVNLTTSSVAEFGMRILKKDTVSGNAYVKAKTDDFAENYIGKIIASWEEGPNTTIYIGFEEDFLTNLKTQYDSDKSLLEICQTAVNVIFKNIVKNFLSNNLRGANVSVEKKGNLSDDERNQRCIVIPLIIDKTKQKIPVYIPTEKKTKEHL